MANRTIFRLSLVLLCFSITRGQVLTHEQCKSRDLQTYILAAISSAYVGGMEKRVVSPVKMALSVNGIPKHSIHMIEMNWFIVDPVNFPNAARFPANAYPGVTVAPIEVIAPPRKDIFGLYTLKSAITFANSSVANKYVIDFDVKIANDCFDVKFIFHNIGKADIIELGGFTELPSSPHLYNISRRVYVAKDPGSSYFQSKFKMTMDYDEPEQAGNRAQLRAESSRRFWKAAPFDPMESDKVVTIVQPTFSLTDLKYQVSEYDFVAVEKNFTRGLLQDHLLLFGTGSGQNQFQIWMETSMEVTLNLDDVSPSVFVSVGDKNRTGVAENGRDYVKFGNTQSYEIVIIGYPAPEVNISTPISDVRSLKTFSHGRSYHLAYLLLHDAGRRDDGVYRIEARNRAGRKNFEFTVTVQN